MKKLKQLLELFAVFFKIGAFTFGGGYAMIPIIEDTCVEKKRWISHDDMMTVTVIAESTPGPIAINCATFVGYRQAGLCGAVAATLGVVLPSFLIIYLISLFGKKLLEFSIVEHAFRAVKIAVALLITDAGVKMLKKTEKKPVPLCIVAVSFTVMLLVSVFAWNFSSIYLMLFFAALAFPLYFLERARRKK